ncbi:ABC transporter ATP-binding protein [Desulfuromonas carbonis]|uniref:ABC transporter ATP-binding protein n=1 Tax=Desulfuromonas sp. DDH964 TaxID=1823759 RepID=UPI00078B4E8A|nr:ABC transporter ATP-binding protein [Desulfuromonas sp. DDH964]AMV73951.1 ABC transporter ATP-binding protein [Desulfuromonas sp. DDH964]
MPAALNIQDLRKSFAGTPAVAGISLQIARGEIFGLLGPNGAGKSTTINMVAGITRIDAGSIAVFGHDNRTEYRIARRLIGVMHQEIVIDNFFTIDQALRFHSGYYGVPDHPPWRRELIDRLGLGPHLHKTMIKLSGGLKRRFMVAKALIHRPPLLILDEPTAGVDVELRHTLWEFVREINQTGTTILLTTHYLEEAEQMCGRIAIMNHGEIVALDRTASLLSRLGNREIRVQLQQPLAALPPKLTDLGARLDKNGLCLDIPLQHGQGAGEALALLCHHGLAVADIETRSAGLEEVFLKLTGRGPNRER